ncbi:hypothetical protein J7L48_02815 [bacterium]|nr:hypothetical protein [bacterium]
MSKHRIKQSEKIYIIKATLSDWSGHVRGLPYRTLAISGESTLYDLAEIITDSYDFDFDHSFGFYDNIRSWTKSIVGYELFADVGQGSKFKSVKRAKVNRIFNNIKKKMLFLFDYGDEWHFVVELRGIELPKENTRYPLVIESFGEASPQYEQMDEEDES